MQQKLLYVAGVQASGSSITAGVCDTLGVVFGGDYQQQIGSSPFPLYEDVGIARACGLVNPYVRSSAVSPLRAARIQVCRRVSAIQAANPDKVVGIKHPYLCAISQLIYNVYYNNLIIINCERDIEKSIASVIRRDGTVHTIAAHEIVQRRLYSQKHNFLRDKRYLTVHYEALLHNTRSVVHSIINHLELSPDAATIERAIALVKPELQHIK